VGFLDHATHFVVVVLVVFVGAISSNKPKAPSFPIGSG